MRMREIEIGERLKEVFLKMLETASSDHSYISGQLKQSCFENIAKIIQKSFMKTEDNDNYFKYTKSFRKCDLCGILEKLYSSAYHTGMEGGEDEFDVEDAYIAIVKLLEGGGR